jgi:hypothetical protein
MENAGQLSAMDVNGLYAISSLQGVPHGYGQATVVPHKPLKPVYSF